MPDHLFAYGSLMFPQVLRTFREEDHQLKDAVLIGYRMMCAKGGVYPTIIPEKSSSVNGKIVYDVGEDLLRELDRYEGEDYERIIVEADVEGEKIECYVYANPQNSRLELVEGWDRSRFEKEQLKTLLSEVFR